MDSPDLATEQPRPVPNESPSVQGMVRVDLEVREQIGRERYGTALQPHNGRDAVRDAYEEALDLACYLRQAIAERGGLEQDLRARLKATSNRANELSNALHEVLSLFTRKGHPGDPCLKTHWIKESTVAGWREVARGGTDTETPLSCRDAT